MSMLLAAQVWHYQLPMARALLLMAICDSAEDDGTGCTASDEYLEWKTGLSRATVYRELRALEVATIITRMRLADGRREITVHLHNAKPKPDWKRPRRRGRPGSAPLENGSQPDTEILTVGNTVSERDPIPVNGSQPEIIGSHCEKNGSHTEINGSQPDASLFYMIHPNDPSYKTQPSEPSYAREDASPATKKKRDAQTQKREAISKDVRAFLEQKHLRRELWQRVCGVLNVSKAQRETYLDRCALYEPTSRNFLLVAVTREQRDRVATWWADAIRIELAHMASADCSLALDYGAPPNAHAKQRSVSA